MTQYRTQATRPDYPEPKEKSPTKSFGQMWKEFKKTRSAAINQKSGWKKTMSMIVHGGLLICGVIILPILLFAIMAHFFGAAVIGATLMLLLIVGVILFFCLMTADLVFDL